MAKNAEFHREFIGDPSSPQVRFSLAIWAYERTNIVRQGGTSASLPADEGFGSDNHQRVAPCVPGIDPVAGGGTGPAIPVILIKVLWQSSLVDHRRALCHEHSRANDLPDQALVPASGSRYDLRTQILSPKGA